MKLLIAAPYYAPEVGGLERYASEMAKVAVQAGHEVVAICSGKEESIVKETWDGVTVYRLPTQVVLSNTPISLRWYRMIKHIIADEAPDIVNVHTPVPFMGDLVIFASRGIPKIVTYHSGSMKKRNPWVDRLIEVYEWFILPVVLHKADRIVCSSEFVRRSFLKRYLAKSESIWPGVDISTFTRRTSEPSGNKVIFIGNFSYGWKGLEYLREAISLVPSAHLVVVGRGTPVAAPRTQYLGTLHGDELVKEIQSSKILVLPSISNSEAFGMVLIEAMACGVPVIGTRIGGLPDTINDQVDGLIVAPRDARALAEAITRLIEDPSLATELSENAYQKVLHHYTWQVQGARYLDLLDRLVTPV